MALITWDDRLKTGHGRIDGQHQELVEAVNRLHAAMKQGKGKDEVGPTLTFLRDYTMSHFKMEEELMDRHAYPGKDKHRQIHKDLVDQVADLVDRYQKGTATLTLPTMTFLEKWLTDHILGEDYRLAEHLRRVGA